MDFDRIINRKGTNSIKWEKYGDALPLWVADMDFLSPQVVIDALHERVDHGIFGYTLPPNELLSAAQAWLKKRHGWEVDIDAITIIPGVMKGVNMTGRAVGRPGDGILLQTPVYYPFFGVPSNNGRLLQTSEIPLVDGRYQIDFEAFEACITDQTRMFLLCNPHNPIGRAFTREELERMAEICLDHDLIICSDEIHSDLVFGGYRHIPIASLSPEVAERTVTTLAPSKTFNIPGLHISVLVIENPDLRKRVLGASGGLVRDANVLGYTAATAAYSHAENWLDELLVYLEANRDYMVNFVETRLPGIKASSPEATFLGWLDCREAHLAENAHKFFLDRAGVALNDGETFGAGGEGFVRLNFACPRATLTDALTRMEKALLANAK